MALQKAVKPLRALDVYGDVPTGCIAFMERDDKHAPHIRAGEWVVVDPNDQDPVRGEVFLIEWIGGGRSLMQAVISKCRGVHQPDGSIMDEELWTLKGLGFCLAEGPMREDYLRTKIVGRVLGLYEPTFDETKLKLIPKARR